MLSDGCTFRDEMPIDEGPAILASVHASTPDSPWRAKTYDGMSKARTDERASVDSCRPPSAPFRSMEQKEQVEQGCSMLHLLDKWNIGTLEPPALDSTAMVPYDFGG